MKNVKVLDSSALISYFEGEKGCEEVTLLLMEAAEGRTEILLSIVNWGEILYIIQRRYGEEKAGIIERLMDQMHLEVVDADRDQTRCASQLKSSHGLPYVDCFAAALALTHQATLVTLDNDFRVLKGKIPITWI